jgi:uncharacterized protein (TIGR02118 family)
MIGTLSLLRHQDQHEIDAFRNHWLNVHGPLAATLPGVRRYAQSHFLPGHALTNDRARTLPVDGLAAISFDNEADRALCYASKQEEVCDVDSLLFIGATARYVSDVENVIVAKRLPAPEKMVVLVFPGTGLPSGTTREIARIPGITGLIVHGITKPGAVPFQPRTQIDLPLQAMLEVSADTLAPLEQARDLVTSATESGADIAVFGAREHSIV